RKYCRAMRRLRPRRVISWWIELAGVALVLAEYIGGLAPCLPEFALEVRPEMRRFGSSQHCANTPQGNGEAVQRVADHAINALDAHLGKDLRHVVLCGPVHAGTPVTQ